MGCVEQDGGERGGHDTSVLQTLCCCIVTKCGVVSFTLHAASSFCRGLRFGGVLKGRHCNSFCGFYSKLDNQV